MAFREKNAVGRVRFFGDALATMIDASAGQVLVLGDATLKVKSAEPLPLAWP